jgi:hypothetical protein
MQLKQLLTLHWKYQLALSREADGHTSTGGHVIGLFLFEASYSPHSHQFH